jgi:hypothetical protein
MSNAGLFPTSLSGGTVQHTRLAPSTSQGHDPLFADKSAVTVTAFFHRWSDLTVIRGSVGDRSNATVFGGYTLWSTLTMPSALYTWAGPLISPVLHITVTLQATTCIQRASA